MDFDTLIAPLTRDEFMSRYRAGTCSVIRGRPGKFTHLITLQEIEDRINDGCNVSHPLQVIDENGQRHPLVAQGVPWTSLSVQKNEVLERLRSGHSFMMMNLSQINPRVAELIDTLEEALSEDALHGDLHLYVSPRGGASAYNAHRDYPQHKIYLQVIGSTEWRVYHHDPDLVDEVRSVQKEDEGKYLEEAAHFTLDPGDLFYMPPAVFHKVRNTAGPRVSFSIPLSPGRGAPRMDRTHIPFKSLFEVSLRESGEISG